MRGDTQRQRAMRFGMTPERVEEIFGRVKTVGGGRTVRLIGRERNQPWAERTTATYNRVRMAKRAAIAT